jgi:hypothetical protein
MAWTFSRHPDGFANWTDFDASGRWFALCARTCSDAEITRLNNHPYAEQLAMVRAAATALGKGYRALGVRCYADPALREAWVHQYGTQGFGVSEADAYYVGDPTGETWHDVARAFATARVSTDEGFACLLRVMLRDDGTVRENCTGPNTGAAACGFALCAPEDDPAHLGCDPYDWHALAWRAPGGPLQVLPPLVWSLRWIRETAAACVARGPRGTWEATRWGVALLNLRETKRYLGADALPEDLAAASLQVPADLDHARWNDPGLQRAGHTIAMIGAAIALVPTPFTIVGGAIVGAVGELIARMPGAVGTESDLFGRARPVLEWGWLADAEPDPARPPAFDPSAPTTAPPVPGRVNVFGSYSNLSTIADPTAVRAAPLARAPAASRTSGSGTGAVLAVGTLAALALLSKARG